MLEGVVVTAAGGELHTLGGCLAASKVVGVRWSGEEASCLNTEQKNLNNRLQRFWDLELLGILKDETSVYSKFTQ